jgi:hypothetical protein
VRLSKDEGLEEGRIGTSPKSVRMRMGERNENVRLQKQLPLYAPPPPGADIRGTTYDSCPPLLSR